MADSWWHRLLHEPASSFTQVFKQMMNVGRDIHVSVKELNQRCLHDPHIMLSEQVKDCGAGRRK